MPTHLLNLSRIWSIECLILMAALAAVALRPRMSGSAGRKLAALFRQWGRRPLVCGIALFAGTFAVTALATLTARLPVPTIHDEFSYLLGAETFVSGRWTNPPHAMWEHFESFHILQQPTYQSKYPPAQSLLLAAGQLMGHPAVGLWLGAGLSTAACYWMLLAWVPRGWALAGGLICSWLMGWFGYWSHCYWGAHTAVMGGALLYGGIRRVVERGGAGSGAAAAAGLLLLANTRPLEGLVVSLPAGVVLAVKLVQAWKSGARLGGYGRALAAMALVLAAGGALMAEYNRRVTGSYLTMPYAAYEREYGSAPLLRVQDPGPMKEYRHAVMREFYEERRKDASEQLSLLQLTLGSSYWWQCGFFFFRLGFVVPMLVITLVPLRGWTRLVWWTAAVTWALVFLEVQVEPRKLAPATALLVLLIVEGMRRMAAGKLRTGGPGAVAAIFALAAGINLLSFAPIMQTGLQPFQRLRPEVIEKLDKLGGKHLVFVRYVPGHVSHEEWVYNAADIDGSKIVWARPMGEQKDEELKRYFKGWRVWQLEAGREHYVLSEVSGAGAK